MSTTTLEKARQWHIRKGDLALASYLENPNKCSLCNESILCEDKRKLAEQNGVSPNGMAQTLGVCIMGVRFASHRLGRSSILRTRTSMNWAVGVLV